MFLTTLSFSRRPYQCGMYVYLREEDDEGKDHKIVEDALGKWAQQNKSNPQMGGLNTQSPSPVKVIDKANNGRAARPVMSTLGEVEEAAA